MSSSGDTASLPYHEPSIATILIIASFLLSLNAVNYVLDRIVYCGLVGQLFIGVAWGTPGANWLSAELQHAVVQLGYIGLILIVYEGEIQTQYTYATSPLMPRYSGGLASDFKALKANLFLSSAVALTGIAAPVALSFVLTAVLPISPVQAFAAGAALCSTSLGTTFTVLATSGLTESRLGVVLASAAMMDDVVGLVMVQIISSLGGDSTFTDITVVRPVFVSLAFVVVYPLLCAFVARPMMRLASTYGRHSKNTQVKALLGSHQAVFVYQTGFLLASITGATYAGTSNLFAAYLAGAAVAWLDDTAISENQQPAYNAESAVTQTHNRSSTQSQQSQTHETSNRELCSSGRDTFTHNVANTHDGNNECSGRKIYERYYSPAVEAILRPLFFASIGFAIPITKMFSGSILWRGIVYTILMVFAKVICGAWLVRFAPMPRSKAISKLLGSIRPSRSHSKKVGAAASTRRSKAALPTSPAPERPSTVGQQSSGPLRGFASGRTSREDASNPGSGPTVETPPSNTSRKRNRLPRPKSLYPAAILGSAMVSRGEIGFLISSVAESRGIFSPGQFLVVTWAILLCTLIGPVSVGLLVKRVKRLQQAERRKASGQEDPLGIWGVLPSTSGAS